MTPKKSTACLQSSRAVKQSHDQILREMEHLNLQYQEEQNRSLGLQNELKMAATSHRKILEVRGCLILQSNPFIKATLGLGPKELP